MLRLFFFFPTHYSDCDYIIICIVYDYYYYYCSIFSPDDIHKLYSGRTVEINNTDAEGRLVLVNFLYFFFSPIQHNTLVYDYHCYLLFSVRWCCILPERSKSYNYIRYGHVNRCTGKMKTQTDTHSQSEIFSDWTSLSLSLFLFACVELIPLQMANSCISLSHGIEYL